MNKRDFWIQQEEESEKRKRKAFRRRVNIILNLEQFGFKVTRLGEDHFRITKDNSGFIFDIHPYEFTYKNQFNGKRGEIRGERRMIPFVKTCYANHLKEKEERNSL